MKLGIAGAVVAALVLVSGCGAGGGNSGAGKASAKASASVSPTAVEAEASESESAEPLTPEETFEAIAERKALAFDEEEYDTAGAYVDDICVSLADASWGDSWTRGQWLMEVQEPSAGERETLREGVPYMCPSWEKTFKAALAGHYVRWFQDGEYEVSGKKGDGFIPAGTYRVKGQLSGCYWERATRSGTIIDNQFATAAREITVTIRSSDGLFVSRDCGTWKPVR